MVPLAEEVRRLAVDEGEQPDDTALLFRRDEAGPRARRSEDEGAVTTAHITNFIGLEFAFWVGIRDFRLMAGGIQEKQQNSWKSRKKRGIHGNGVEFSQKARHSTCIMEFGSSF